MVSPTVNQILVTPLRRIPVEAGDVLHGIKYNEPGYIDFGEAYFSLINFSAVKAWKRHLRMTLNLVVPLGTVLFVFLDDSGQIRIQKAGETPYVRITVPPGIWFGFKGLASPYSLLMNLADIVHDPTEIERKDFTDVNFDWNFYS